MANDHHSPQGRRPHYHRGRRNNDRRGGDRRAAPPPQETTNRDQVDVEQIMRDIRSRISRRHGIDLSPQQIHELAARRLEAILEPKHVKPALLEQMRRAAGEAIEVPPSATAAPVASLDESALYASHRGFLNTLRRWLKPILKLFINPAPLVQAVNAQAARAAEAAAREAEMYARQAEWNALHYEILQRLVLELSRESIEMQQLAMRVESLAAKVDFNERRVRGLETAGTATRPQPRTAPPAEGSRDVVSPPAAAQGATAAATESSEGNSEGSRRRRRRRRGRRSGPMGLPGAPMEAGASGADLDAGEPDENDVEGGEDGPEAAEAAQDERVNPAFMSAAPETPGAASTALEPAHAFSLLQPVERSPAAEPPPPVADAAVSPERAPEPASPATSTPDEAGPPPGGSGIERPDER